MSKEKYIIYGLINPKNHELFYIGVTKQLLRDRKTGHRCEARIKKDEKGAIIKSLKYNFNIAALETMVCEKNKALAREDELICEFIKKGHYLCNATIRPHKTIKSITNEAVSTRVINALFKAKFTVWEIMALMGYKSTNSVAILLDK